MSGEKYLRVHRVVAELKIGRPLARNEIVHHKDHDVLNNHPDNLEVMTRADHARLHFKDSPHSKVTHCKRGHELDAENVYITTQGRRACRVCRRKYAKLWHKAERHARGLKKPGPKAGSASLANIIAANKRRAKK